MRSTVVLFALALAGCATHPVPTEEAEAIQPTRWGNPADGSATLIVKRDSGLMGAACSARVFVNGEEIGRLRPSQKVVLHLPHGPHMVGAQNAGCGSALSEAAVTLASGQTAVYRIAIGDAGAIFLQPTAF